MNRNMYRPCRLRTRLGVFMPVVVSVILLLGLSGGSAHAALNEWSPLGPWGGDRYRIYIDPGDSQTLYVVGFGIHKSTDGGGHWTPLQDTDVPCPGLLAFSLAFDPRDSQVLYLGTMSGVWKSTNGGASWTSSSEGIAEVDRHIRNIVVDARFPDHVYASVSRVFAYENMLTLANGRAIEHAIYRSLDGGASWEPFDQGMTQPLRDVTTVYQDPHTGELFAATYGSGIFRYDEDLLEWVPSSTGLSDPLGLWITSIAFDPVNPGTMYAATKKDWIYRSHDSGRSWSHVSYSLPMEADYPPMVLFITVDPNNPDMVWASAFAGMDRPDETPFYWADLDQSLGGLYLSTDGGLQWDRVAWNTDLYPDSGPYGITFDPVEVVGSPPYEHSRVVYVATTSIAGVLKSEDGGSTYARKIEGLNGMAANSFLQDPSDPDRLFVTTEGVLHFSFDRGQTWSRFVPVTPDGLIWVWDTAIDPDRPDTLYYATGEPAWAWSQNKGLYRVRIADLDPSVEINNIGPGRQIDSTAGIGIWKVYPKPNGVLYLATQDSGILKSEDRGNYWQPLNEGLEETSVTCIVFDPLDRPRFAGTRTSDGTRGASLWSDAEGGGVYEWDPDLQVWHRLGATVLVDAVYDILVSPVDPEKVWVASKAGIFFSQDGGLTWEARDDGLPEGVDFLCSDLEASPSQPGLLVASSWAYGVYLSPDEGKHWFPYRSGLYPWFVEHVRFDLSDDSVLYAATLGASVFRCDVGNLPVVDMVEANGVQLASPYEVSVPEMSSLSIRVQAHDPDGEPLTYSAYLNGVEVPAPGTVQDPDATYTFDPDSQTFSWTPPYTASSSSPFRLTLVVSDGQLTSFVPVTVNVLPIHPPSVVAVTANGQVLVEPYEVSVKEEQFLEIQIDAEDADGDPLQYQLYLGGQVVPAPGQVADPGGTYIFDPETRLFRWKPPLTSSQHSPVDLVVEISDGKLVTYATVTIQILPIHPPAITALTANGTSLQAPYQVTVQEESLLEIRVDVEDIDGDPVEVSAYWNGVPVGSAGDGSSGPVFFPGTLTFRWQPPYGSSAYNPHQVTLVVTDGFFVVTADIVVEVGPLPAPLFDRLWADTVELASPYEVHVGEMEPLQIRFEAHDPLGGNLRFLAYFLGSPVPSPQEVAYPAEVFSFDEQTRTFSWIPPYGTAGETPYSLILVAVADPAWSMVEVRIFVDQRDPVVAPVVQLSLNQALFRWGDTMILEMDLVNFAAPVATDLYLALGTPDDPYLLSFPLFQGVELPSFLKLEGLGLVQLTLQDTWPYGAYVWSLVLTRSGGSVEDPGSWLSSASASFTVEAAAP